MSKSTIAFQVGKALQIGIVLLILAFSGKKSYDAYKETKGKPKK